MNDHVLVLLYSYTFFLHVGIRPDEDNTRQIVPVLLRLKSLLTCIYPRHTSQRSNEVRIYDETLIFFADFLRGMGICEEWMDFRKIRY